MSSVEKILTIDIGTSAIKAALFEASGRMLRVEARRYTRSRHHGMQAEQDPHEWWELTCELIRSITSELGDERSDIRALAVTGQMHGVVLLGKAGPLGPVMTFQDRRAQREHEELLAHRETFYRIAGAYPEVGSVPAKLLYLSRHGRDLLDEAEFVIPPKDYIRYELTGQIATDPIDAAGFLLYDLEAGVWSRNLCELVLLEPRKLPEVRPTVSAAGRLKRDVAGELGLPDDASIAVSGGDDIEALGSGMGPGDCYEHLGSSGSIYAPSTGIVRDPDRRLEIYPDLVPGRYMVGGSTAAAGAAERWFRENILPRDVDAENVFRRAVDTGRPSDVVFLPYLAGARCPVWNPERRGAFVGLSLSHTAQDLYEAIAEGVTYSLRSILERLEALGLGRGGAVYTAGGYGASQAFGQVRADIYGREVRRTTQGEATSFAAMLIAGTVAGFFNDVYEAAAGLRKLAWSASPRPETRAAYDAGYARFRMASEHLRAV